MNSKLASAYIHTIRVRVSQGDCPAEKALPVEALEELVLTLADAAEKVCAYDWSDNDEDAVAAVAQLRAVVHG